MSTGLSPMELNAPSQSVSRGEGLPSLLRRALEHHPSPGPMSWRVLEHIDQLSGTELWDRVAPLWGNVIRSPMLFEALFPGSLGQPSLATLLRSFECPEILASFPQLKALQHQWLAQEHDLERPGGCLHRLMEELGAGPPAQAAPVYYARLFTFLDLLHATLVTREFLPFLRTVQTELHHQRVAWPGSYCGGYAYQGLEDLGIQGWKPSERRLEAYRIEDLLRGDDRILDIGANCGFLAVHLARHAEHVLGVELNPFLVRIGEAAASTLGLANVKLVAADFASYRPDEKFTKVFSLSNHHTIDGRLALRFEEYLLRCWSVLEDGGHLLFESHNVFGSGSGKAGDDGDLERKFEIVERWFEIERLHMVRAFVPGADIDKLFVVLRKRDGYAPDAVRTLDLESARRCYLD